MVNSVNKHLSKNFDNKTVLGPCTKCDTVIHDENKKECPNCSKQQPLRNKGGEIEQ